MSYNSANDSNQMYPAFDYSFSNDNNPNQWQMVKGKSKTPAKITCAREISKEAKDKKLLAKHQF
eukprot:143619-Ditylum_brightwellii.AAC.1